MVDESENRHEVNPRFVAVIHAMMDLFKAFGNYPESPESVVKEWTLNELDQGRDYCRALTRSLAPWHTAFRKEKLRRLREEKLRSKARGEQA
jgi:hypothetical protein